MVMRNPSLTLIIATYNWPEALELCLKSILQQTIMPDEVIIADDGSREATKIVITHYQQQFKVPLVHVWQEDTGFQLSKIRNKAIARAEMEYIVQIDGDLMLERHFIEDHMTFSRAGAFVSGTRVQMSSQLSAELISKNIIDVSIFSKGITNFSNTLRIPMLRKFLAERYKSNDITYVRGCNMAFWKADLIKVNGYNEAIVGWGREDSELAVRLSNSGIKKRILKFGAVTFHIYHPEAQRQQLNENDGILKNSIANNAKTCKFGLSQYL